MNDFDSSNGELRETEGALRETKEELRETKGRLRETKEELRETREELRETEAHLDLVLDAGDVTAARVDTDLRHTWVHDPNPEGPSEGEIVGKRDDELFPPDVAEPTMAIKREVLETGERVSREITFQKPGGERDCRMTAEPTRDETGDVTGVRHVAFDVTDEYALEARERELRAFREAVEHAGHSIYFTDVDGAIEYVNPTFEETTGYDAAAVLGEDPSILSSGEHDDAFYRDLWETIFDGEVWTGEVVNERKDGEEYVVNQTIAPIEGRDGEIQRFVAVNDDITTREEREQTLRAQRDTLKRLEEIIESLRPINRILSDASTRDELDQPVCDRLAASEAYDFAWLADYRPGLDALDPHAWAGIEDDYLDEVTITTDDSPTSRGPSGRAARTGEVQVVRDVSTDETFGPWREQALERGFEGAAAVPLVHDEQVYGVLAVYTGRANAFDDREQALLAELGDRIGHAIHAIRTERLLHADAVVELTFESEDSFWTNVTDRLDCRFEVESVVPSADGSLVHYVTVRDAPPDAVLDVADAAETITDARVVREDESESLLELAVTGDTFAYVLTRAGAVVTSDVAERGTLRVVCEVPTATDVRTLVERVQTVDPHATLVARRQVNRGDEGDPNVHTATERLTDRQREVLEAAYHAGHFDWPRDSTVEEMADALGVTSPTFLNHKRKGVKRLLGLVFGGFAATG